MDMEPLNALDQMAMAAMQGLLAACPEDSAYWVSGRVDKKKLAQHSYDIAEAMLEEAIHRMQP